MRKCHMLKANKRSETWRHVCFFDTETNASQQDGGGALHTYRLGWANYTNRGTDHTEWFYATAPDVLLHWMTTQAPPKATLYLFAHNLYFDFKVLNAHTLLPLWGWTLTALYFAESGLQGFIEFRRGSSRLVFIDSLNYFAVSLKDLGTKVGTEKMECDPLTAPLETVKEYCQQDVKIVREAMLSLMTWVTVNDLGNMQKTLASLALTAFRHRFMDFPVYIHDVQQALTLEREAYHGGRVDVFFRGKQSGTFYQLDVNSMYPFVMKHYQMPHKLVAYYPHQQTVEHLRKATGRYFVIARVTIKTSTERYPLKTDNMLTHPVGTFTTTLCQGSLIAALANNEVKAVHEMACYYEVPLFISFVYYFWNKRVEAQTEGKKTDAYFFKRLMNALYGKWGQKKEHTVMRATEDTDAFDSMPFVVDGLHCTRWRFAGKELWRFPSHCQAGFCLKPTECDKTHCTLTADTEAAHSFPAISAAITDYARCFLWDLIVVAGEHNCYYVDTDCLVVNQAGYNNLSAHIGPDLGQLKLEKSFSELEIFSPKDYHFGDTVKHKGVSAKAVWMEEKGVWQQTQFERFRGGLRKGAGNGILVKTITKRLFRDLKTRRPGPGGWTEPLVQEGDPLIAG